MGQVKLDGPTDYTVTASMLSPALGFTFLDKTMSSGTALAGTVYTVNVA